MMSNSLLTVTTESEPLPARWAMSVARRLGEQYWVALVNENREIEFPVFQKGQTTRNADGTLPPMVEIDYNRLAVVVERVEWPAKMVAAIAWARESEDNHFVVLSTGYRHRVYRGILQYQTPNMGVGDWKPVCEIDQTLMCAIVEWKEVPLDVEAEIRLSPGTGDRREQGPAFKVEEGPGTPVSDSLFVSTKNVGVLRLPPTEVESNDVSNDESNNASHDQQLKLFGHELFRVLLAAELNAVSGDREQRRDLLVRLNTLSENIQDAVSAFQLNGEQSDEKE